MELRRAAASDGGRRVQTTFCMGPPDWDRNLDISRHTEPVLDCCVQSGNGTQAATVAAGIAFKRPTDNSVRPWDVASGKEVRRFNYSGALRTIQFSSDGKDSLWASRT
jgi:hypothetical protein